VTGNLSSEQRVTFFQIVAYHFHVDLLSRLEIAQLQLTKIEQNIKYENRFIPIDDASFDRFRK